MKGRAVLYARVSSDDRPKGERNIKGQIDMCRQHAIEKGWEVVAELSEDAKGASGYQLELPQLEKALEMARDKEYEVLIVREMDRLSRKISKQIRIEEILENYSVKIEYVIERYPDTPEGQLLKNVRAVIAEYEREKILERLNRGRRLVIRSGSIIKPSRILYGYKVVVKDGIKQLAINKNEAAIVKKIYHWYAGDQLDGKPLSLAQIARNLNESGVETRSRSKSDDRTRFRIGDKWRISAIKNILTKKTYIGKWQYGKTYTDENGKVLERDNDDILELNVPPIISAELWKSVQNRIQAKKKKRALIQKEFLLYGRLQCSHCGSNIIIYHYKETSGKQRRYYSCGKGIKRNNSCNNFRYFPAEWIEENTMEWSIALVSEFENEKYENNQKEEIEKQTAHNGLIDIDKAEKRRDTHMKYQINLYLAGILSIEQLDTSFNEISEERHRSHQINEACMHLIKPPLLTEKSQLRLSLSTFKADEISGEGDSAQEKRRKFVELLDISGYLGIEDGKLVARISSILGKTMFSMEPRRKPMKRKQQQ